MQGFVTINSPAGVMRVRPAAVSAVAPVPNAINQVQVIIDSVPIVVPLSVDGFLAQLAGENPAGPRLIG